MRSTPVDPKRRRTSALRWSVGGLALVLIVALKFAWDGYPRTFELQWEEEVQLHDGRVVVIGRAIEYERLGRWSGYEDSIPRKETLTFNPEGETRPREVSFPNLRLMVFDVYEGVNYLVLTATSGRSRMPSDSPFPVGEPPGDYRVLRWSGDRFVQIPLKDLPSAIVHRNLSWDDSARRMRPYDGKKLSIADKQQIRVEVFRPDRISREVVR